MNKEEFLADHFDNIEELEPRYMFERLGYEYDFIQNENSEDTITYHKDNLHIQFNLTSKLVVLQNDTSYMFYNSAVFMLNSKLLLAINEQIEELGWDNDKTN